jgi:hypothetical protein
MNIIFLDIDGVFNCQIFFKNSAKGVSYVESMICKERVSWFNELCKDVKAKVVISSTWRMGKSLDEMKEIFAEVGGDFDIIGKTPILRGDASVRGNEIKLWLDKNIESVCGIPERDFKSYVIIDDDSDMLYEHRNHLFLTDNYSGLTPITCYKVRRFFGGKMFPLLDADKPDEK